MQYITLLTIVFFYYRDVIFTSILNYQEAEIQRGGISCVIVRRRVLNVCLKISRADVGSVGVSLPLDGISQSERNWIGLDKYKIQEGRVATE